MNRLQAAFTSSLASHVQKTDGVPASQALMTYVKTAAAPGVEAITISTSGDIATYNDIQQLIRSVFGKEGFQEPNIGDHPDFIHLKGTNKAEYNHVVTLFMDIEASTRLNLLYSPQDVFLIKNAFISCAIALISAFDGHVHRIMGDAVMAYFGGKETTAEDDVINSLNCASLLMYFADNVVRKQLKEIYGYEDPFGIRIGIDYGPKDEVLWASYGFPGSSEVTATSFYVDVASKLQHSAPRNQIMLGQSLRDYVDFPECLLSVKTYTEAGETYKEPFLTPNLTDRDGNSINYRKYLLNWQEYLKYSPAPVLDSEYILGNERNLTVKASVHEGKEGPKLFDLTPLNRFLEKGLWIRFEITAPSYIQTYPYTVKFAVENHGLEAGSDTFHEKITEVSNHIEARRPLVHWESTKFRGLHYMTIELKHKDHFYKSRFGVVIK